MRPNRKRIVAAVVFAVTLVLGTTALVLAWRLQQEKKITEEEAAACTPCSRNQSGNPGDYCEYSWKDYPCEYGIKYEVDLTCKGNINSTGDKCNGCQTVNSKIQIGTCGGGTSCGVDCTNNGGKCCQSSCCKGDCNKPTPCTVTCNPNIDLTKCGFVPGTWVCDGQHDQCTDSMPSHRDGQTTYSFTDQNDWCTTVQNDSNTQGAFSVVWIGDAGDWCYTYCNDVNADCAGKNGVPQYKCNAPHSGATNPNQLDWNCTPAQEPTITCTDKSSNQNDGVTPGETITYTVSYTITEQDLKTLQFTDSHSPAGILSATVREITPGLVCEDVVAGQFSCTINGTDAAAQALRSIGSHQVSFIVNVNQARLMDIDQITNNIYEFNGTWGDNNTAVTGDTTACTDTVNVETNPEAVCTSKDITKVNSIPVSEETPTIDPGDEVEFTIGYENSGDVAGKVMVSDPIPTGFESPEIVSPATGCSISSNILTCSIQTEAGASGNVIFKATAKENVRDLLTTNRATVRLDINNDGVADDTGPDATENQACSTAPEVSTGGAVCSYKNASAGYNEQHPVKPGDIVDYTIGFQATKAPVDLVITEKIPENLTILQTYVSTCTRNSLTEYPVCSQNNFDDLCGIANDVLTCNLGFYGTGDYTGTLTYHAQISATEIPVDGATITNEVYVYEEGNTPQEGEDNPDECDETIYVEHEAPSCVATTPNVMTIRVADLAGTNVSLTTKGNLGTHSDLDFKWTATCGTLSNTEWHASSGTPTGGIVSDTVAWTPPTDGTEGETCELKVYVRPTGSTDATGVSDDDCESTATITALDLICNWLVPNNEYQYFPFDMTFAADIGGDQGATFSYDLNFGDGSTHYTGTGTVASGTTVELPHIPPQDQPHTYDSNTPTNLAPSLTVTNTETGETSVCPTVLAGLTQSSWSIVKDSNVDTCVAENSTVTYTIIVTNTGDYTADLAEVRDTLDSKVDTFTLTNIRECDSNGLNCTTYNKTDVLNGRTITWPGKTFTAGESRKYSYTITISSAGDYYNVAEAIPEAGETVRDDELFPTCKGKAPATGVMTTAVLVAILGAIIVGAGAYVYKTETGAQIVANVLGKTTRAIRRTTRRKEAFERDAMKASKDKLKT